MPLARLAEGAQGGVRVEERAPGAWRIGFAARSPGKLAVAETWDLGWRATLNGKPVEVEPFRDVLLGVAVGAGPGRIELRYHPDGFTAGMVSSLLGLAAVALGGVWKGKGRRRRNTQ